MISFNESGLYEEGGADVCEAVQSVLCDGASECDILFKFYRFIVY